MFVRIENEKLTSWAEWEFEGSTFVDLDYSTFDPEKYEIDDGGKLVDISNTEKYKAKEVQKEYERLQRLTLTQRQLRLYLLDEWKLTDEMIRQFLDAKGLIEWDFASVFVRGNPLFDFVASKIGKTPEDVNKMFLEAPGIYG